MPDLLTHVLVVFALGRVAARRLDGIDARYVPVAMVGAVIPDLAKIRLLVGAGRVEHLLGLPFSWYPIHRLGGAVALVGLAALFFERGTRLRAAGYLLAGAATQFVLDGLIDRANGLSPPYLYPLSWWQPPAGGLYLSSDVWPTVVALGLAGTVVAVEWATARGT